MPETRPRPGNAVPATISDVPKHTGSGYPEPFASRMGACEKQSLGDLFDLTQFGVVEVTLQAGAQSALRHWHSLEDEFVYMLAGKLTLITDDGETVLEPGQCIGFKAGRRNAHHLVNQGTAPATFLAVGSRIASDNAFYPDDDLLWVERPDGIMPAHKDGRFYQD